MKTSLSSGSLAAVVIGSILWWWSNRGIATTTTTFATATTTTTTSTITAAERHHHATIWFASSSSSSSSSTSSLYRPQQLPQRFDRFHYYDHNIHARRRPLPSGSSSPRILQQQQPPNATPALCNDTTINFPDDAGLNFHLFGSTTSDLYESTCFCQEDDNEDEVIAQLGQLDLVDDVVTFVDSFNTLVGQLMFSSNFSCTNECSSCFVSRDNNGTVVCGFFTVEESSDIQTGAGNFTIEEILAGPTNEDIAALVDTAVLHMENCVQYTGDAYGNSKVCFITDLTSLPDETEPVFCNITYNDVLCDSCVVPGVAFNSSDDAAGECIVADCTNVDATYGTMIDTCEMVGVGGPFQFFALRDVVNATTFTLGTCNDNVPAPSTTVATPPTVLPTANTTGPTSTTDITTTSVPTSVPVLISEPTEPDNTTAPMRAPTVVAAPVLAAPVLILPTTSDTTRRCSRTALVAMWTCCGTVLSMMV